MSALDLAHAGKTILRLRERSTNKSPPRTRNRFPLRRVLQIIVATRDQFLRFDHHEMFARHERRKSFAGFGDDAAAVREANEHPVPLEIPQLRVMQVEQDL